MHKDDPLALASTRNLPTMRVGDDDFKSLLLNSDIFVDKSLFVRDVIQNSGYVTLVTRPRRWGKSLNINMLKRFLEIEVDAQGEPLPPEQSMNSKLFTGGEVVLGFGETKQLQPLKIAKYQDIIKRQGKFPVILLNLKDVKGNSYQEIETGVRNQIISLFVQHKYLKQYLNTDSFTLEESQKEKFSRYFKGDITTDDLKSSLRDLSELLFKHFGQKSYILIDEYDTPINSSYLEFGHKSEEFEKVLRLFRAMFGSSLKTNPNLEKGVITGILRIAKANLFSDLNNLTENTLLDEDFNSSYGFTQEEVDELLAKVPTETDPQQIKDWYNGYTFGSEIIYNPWSIMQCLAHKGKLDHYWIDSGGTGLIDKALLSDEMQEDLQKLASGESISSPISKYISFDDINSRIGLFSLLLFSGYLNPLAENEEEDIYRLSAPNNEVRQLYRIRLLQWVSKKLDIDRSTYYSFVTLLPLGKVEEFRDRLQELLHNSTSFHQTGKSRAELFYSGFMLGLVNTLAPSHTIESEAESGDGRADIVLIPHSGKGDQAIIIEYKVSKTKEDLPLMAKTGLEQIIDRRYDLKISQHLHVKRVLKIAMAFCGKEVELLYQIDDLVGSESSPGNSTVGTK